MTKLIATAPHGALNVGCILLEPKSEQGNWNCRSLDMPRRRFTSKASRPDLHGPAMKKLHTRSLGHLVPGWV